MTRHNYLLKTYFQPAFMFCLILAIPYCTKPKVHDLFPRPATTHASRQFFGCRINGLPFIPRAASSTLLGSCTYTQIYRGGSGWTFKLSSNRQESPCRTVSVAITLDSIALNEGKTYSLGSAGSKKSFATYSIIPDCSADKQDWNTTDEKPGQITITKFDRANEFVSGSFSFTVNDSSGNVYRISDGLFDKLFSN